MGALVFFKTPQVDQLGPLGSRCQAGVGCTTSSLLGVKAFHLSQMKKEKKDLDQECLQTAMHIWHLQNQSREAAGLVRRASGCNTELEKWQPTHRELWGKKFVKETLLGKNCQVLATLPCSLIGWGLPEEWRPSPESHQHCYWWLSANCTPCSWTASFLLKWGINSAPLTWSLCVANTKNIAFLSKQELWDLEKLCLRRKQYLGD